MITAIATAGLFLAITAVLQFSMWAEGWLASSARTIEKRVPESIPLVSGNDPPHFIEHDTVRAA